MAQPKHWLSWLHSEVHVLLFVIRGTASFFLKLASTHITLKQGLNGKENTLQTSHHTCLKILFGWAKCPLKEPLVPGIGAVSTTRKKPWKGAKQLE